MKIEKQSNRKVIIFTDYRGQFYSSLRISTGGMDLSVVKNIFVSMGYDLEILSFVDFDPARDYTETIVIYQSSEDRGLIYKSFIQDVISMVETNGGELVPSKKLFECHENKVFQSLFFSNIEIDKLIIPKGKVFGTYEEFMQKIDFIELPVVIKKSSGCQSLSVELARTKKELIKHARQISSTFNLWDWIKFNLKRIIKVGYIKESLNRSKFIVQQMIDGLDGDYKVLVYWDKVYVLSRKNRPNDFRASGSGLFSFRKNVSELILNTALDFRKKTNSPFVSMDIGYKENKCYLLEAQFLMFGTYTLEKSEFYFQMKNGVWEMIEGKSTLEKEFSYAIDNFLKNKSYV